MIKKKILSIGWRICMPLVKIKYRLFSHVRFDGHTFISYDSVFEGNNSVGLGSRLRSVVMGLGTYVSDYCDLYATRIGRFTCIGPRVSTVNGNHPLDFVSVHPAFFRKDGINGLSFADEQKFNEFKYLDQDKKVSVDIGNDVWIGADVRIMEGVQIGDGAVIAAGSLITRNVPPYEIWMGTPAKKSRDRLSDEIKDKMLKIKWWNSPVAELTKMSSKFDSVDSFLNEYKDYERN